MSEFTWDILIIIGLLILNGILAMSEAALLAVRLARLHHLSNEGDKRAKSALKLAENPNQFLSTIQVGITLIDVMTGAIGGATLAVIVTGWLAKNKVLEPYSHSLGLIIVVGSITFLSIILGELVPKRIALRNPERVASLVARPMEIASRLMSPVVRLLSASTEFVLKLLGVRESINPPVSEQELQVLLDQGTQAGVFEATEQNMVEGVFSLNDRRLSSLMTPRSEIIWLDVNDPPQVIRKKISESPYSRLPVCSNNIDHLLGVVKAKDVLLAEYNKDKRQLKDILQPALFLPETAYGKHALAMFLEGKAEVIFIIDEFGVVQGLVTLVDIVSEIIGEVANAGPQATQRQDGSWLLDGMFSVEDFKEIFNLHSLPEEDEYETLAGLVLILMGRIPKAADQCDWNGLRLEIMDMDGNRIDKVLVTTLPAVLSNDEKKPGEK
jgi:putative hemolysin